MISFAVFLLIIFSFVWGSFYLHGLLGRHSRNLEPGGHEAMITMLREEVDLLTVRLGRMEEEVDFFKALKAPEEPEVRDDKEPMP